jgi:hypothetical protein
MAQAFKGITQVENGDQMVPMAVQREAEGEEGLLYPEGALGEAAALGAGLKVVAEWKGGDLMAHSEAGVLFRSGVEEAALVSLALLVYGSTDFHVACMWSAMQYLSFHHSHNRKATSILFCLLRCHR